MKYTLVELPPDEISLEEDSFVEASSVEELAEQADVEDEVLHRLFLPGKEIGHYRVLGYVASGGMGDIYAAERLTEDGRRVGPLALKVISPELRGDWQIEERFKREAAISKAIRSPHVTRVYEFGESDDGHMFLSMELLRGEELFDRVYTLGKLPERDVAQIFLSLLQGLHIVHDSGFIHRDLKPENIYFARVKDKEIVKILDFGIAKRANEPSDPFLSVVGKIYGTPEYISPEQGLSPDVDARSDLYSVGVMMHECLTGKLPFQGPTAYATIVLHQTEPPPPLPGVDPDFAKIVMRAMAKKPRDRYQSAVEIAADLHRWYVTNHDDNFSAKIRESQIPLPHPRLETPTNTPQTPVEGSPVPNLMPTSRQQARRAKGKTPGRVPNPAHAGETAPAAERTQPTSNIPYIVTGIAVALIVGAVLFAMLF